MPFSDRYRSAGLSHNPFAAPQAGDRPVTAFVDRGLPAPPPPGSATLVQVIGESGLGKSSQLAHWRNWSPGPYHYIARRPYRERWTAPPKPVDGVTIYGDEIDRMPRPLRRRWFRELAQAAATLVIGTHVDLRAIGEASGFSVITHELQPVDRETLRAIIDRRLDAAKLASPAATELDLRFSDADVERVLAASNGVPGEADVWCHQILADIVSDEVSVKTRTEPLREDGRRAKLVVDGVADLGVEP